MARNQSKGTVLRSPMAAMRQRTKLRSEVGGEQPNGDYAENLKWFRDFGNEDEGKISEDAVKFAQKTDVSPEMNGLLRASNSVEARALALDAGRRMADPNVQIKSDKSADEILKLTFGNKDIRDAAKALAQKVTEEAFQTFGHLQDGFGSKGERIADEKPNGIAVRPLQMRADVESILMNYAGGVALGITNHATYGMGKQFVDSVGQRIERESRAYGQYGVDKAQGGIVSMFNKALTAMNSQIERKLPKAIINA